MTDLRLSLIMAMATARGEVLDDERVRSIVVQVFGGYQPIDISQFEPRQCGALVFQAERAAQILPELHRLHELHWNETEAYRHGLEMSTEGYAEGLAEEEAGTMLQLTARHQGMLVGNYRMYIRRSRHTNTLFATEDTLYLMPEYRAGRNGLRFIQYMEDCMRLLGVREIRQDAKTVNGTARLLEHLGYEPVPVQSFVKFLKENDHVL